MVFSCLANLVLIVVVKILWSDSKGYASEAEMSLEEFRYFLLIRTKSIWANLVESSGGEKLGWAGVLKVQRSLWDFSSHVLATTYWFSRQNCINSSLFSRWPSLSDSIGSSSGLKMCGPMTDSSEVARSRILVLKSPPTTWRLAFLEKAWLMAFSC